MPELPEVETIRCGIAPYLIGQTITRVVVRDRRLRWPVPQDLEQTLTGQTVKKVERRGKYLMLCAETGTILLHLGMSGRLRILPGNAPVGKHDHVDIELGGGRCLRLTDPRRFGALLWTTQAPEAHPLLRHLGPEPLGEHFTAAYLHALARGRRAPVKTFVMNSRVVVGVGNIYANEALFMAGISPRRAAGRISEARFEMLVGAVRDVLTEAIRQGGTTLRDFVGGEGMPGYFQQFLRVYDRGRLPCIVCGKSIQTIRLGQRATYYCPHCQR